MILTCTIQYKNVKPKSISEQYIKNMYLKWCSNKIDLQINSWSYSHLYGNRTEKGKYSPLSGKCLGRRESHELTMGRHPRSIGSKYTMAQRLIVAGLA